MDFRFTEAEERFREEVKTFLKETLPPGSGRRRGQMMGGGAEARGNARGQQVREDVRKFIQAVVTKGWHTAAWPKEYGGQGRTVMEQLIYAEEMNKAHAPGAGGFGTRWVGPMVMAFGTEEQKKTHVPRIIKNEVSWCTLYSEPNAGSDLASLQTRAEEDGDFFVVNGQKIWTSGAHLADWGILACRTDQNMERHRGISVLLVEMKTPGITVRPLVNMAGSAGFNQVFFDNVRVPKNNLLGEKNRGWQILRFGLNFERSRTNFVLQAAENIAGLVQFAKERARNGKPLSKDPMVRQKLADLAIRNRVSKNLSYRIVWMQATNQTITYQANVDKVFETELTQEIARMGIFLAGMHGQLLRGPHALLDGQPAQSYLQTVGLTIAAGTSEVQRNGIAQGLGLPRSYEV